MKYLNSTITWLKNNLVTIFLALIFVLYVYANGKSAQNKADEIQESFVCQTTCFPQQHEYIYAGEAASCWCYTDKTTLKKIANE